MATIILNSKAETKSSVMPILYRKPTPPAALLAPTAATAGVAASYCSKYGQLLDRHIRTLDDLRDVLDVPLALLRKHMNTMSGSTPSDTDTINDEMSKIKDLIDGHIPEFPDTDTIDNMLEKCGLMKSGLLDGLIDIDALLDIFFDMQAGGISDTIQKALADMLDIAEKGAAFLLNALGELVKKLNLKALLDLLDPLLECLDSMCGSDVSNQVEYINRTLDDLCIDDAGNFDPVKAMKDIELDPTVKSNTTGIGAKIEENSGNAWKKIEDSGTTLKDKFNEVKSSKTIKALS